MGACFAHTTLDYVAHINIAHAHKNHVVVDAVSGNGEGGDITGRNEIGFIVIAS